MKEKMERVGKEKARKTCVENIGTKVVKNSKGKKVSRKNKKYRMTK